MKYNLMLVIGTLIFAACEKPMPQMKTTKFGYKYINHTNLKGETPKQGDVVYYHVQHKNGDVITFDSRTGGRTPNYMVIPDFATLSTPKPSPILDLLKELTIGDSASVFYPLSNVPLPPPGYEDAEQIEYVVKVENIEDGETVIADRLEPAIDTINVKDIAELSTADLPRPTGESSLSEKEKRELWNKSITAQITQAMDVLVDKYLDGTLERDGKLQSLPGGLQYFNMETGDGVSPKDGDTITAHFHGVLTNKKTIESTFETDAQKTVKLGSGALPKGLEEGLKQMKVNGNATFIIPPALGYGSEGNLRLNIPPNAQLIYYVSLTDVK